MFIDNEHVGILNMYSLYYLSSKRRKILEKKNRMAAIITDFRILSQTKYEKSYDCSTPSGVGVRGC